MKKWLLVVLVILVYTPFVNAQGAGEVRYEITTTGQLGVPDTLRKNVLLDGLVTGAEFESVFAVPSGLSVNERGSVTFSHPIKLPEGPAGMQPSVAINCDSHKDNGLVGMRCGLAFGSVIQRFDAGHGFRFQENQNGRHPADSYAFNPAGPDVAPVSDNELLPNGNYFHTRRESWIRFEKSGNICNTGSKILSGPCYWKAYHGDGSITYYGGDEQCNSSAWNGACGAGAKPLASWTRTSDLRIGTTNVGGMIWYPRKTVDIYGNVIVYQYIAGLHYGQGVPILYPKRIKYSVNQGEATNNYHAVEFWYPSDGVSDVDDDVRPDPTSFPSYEKRLKKIKIIAVERGHQKPIREYLLSYGLSGSGKSLLHAIHERGLNPSSSNATTGASNPSTYTSNPPVTLTWNDIDYDAHPPFTAESLQVLGLPERPADDDFGYKTGYGNYDDLIFTSEDDYPVMVQTGDVDGNGTADVVVLYKGKYYRNGGGRNPPEEYRGRNLIYLYRGVHGANGGELAPPETIQIFPVLNPRDPNALGVVRRYNDDVRIFLADVNGDGIKDLVTTESYLDVQQERDNFGHIKISVTSLASQVNLSSNLTIFLPRTDQIPCSGANSICNLPFIPGEDVPKYLNFSRLDIFPVDNNADGKDDLALVYDIGPKKMVITLQGSSSGYATFNKTRQVQFLDFPVDWFDPRQIVSRPLSQERMRFGDVNGDGVTDLVYSLRPEYLIRTQSSTKGVVGVRTEVPRNGFYRLQRPGGMEISYSLGIPNGGFENFKESVLPFVDDRSPLGFFSYEMLLDNFNADKRADLVVMARGHWKTGTITVDRSDYVGGEALTAISDLFNGSESTLGTGTYDPFGFHLVQLSGVEENPAASGGMQLPFRVYNHLRREFPADFSQVRAGHWAWSNPSASHEFHTGDINCDGVSDVVTSYAGQHGFEVESAYAETGIGAAKIQYDQEPAQMPSYFGRLMRFIRHPANASSIPGGLYDGIPASAKGHSVLADIDGDRCMDYVFAQSDVGGVATLAWIKGSPQGFEQDIHTLQWAAAGRIDVLLPADLDGDGDQEIVAIGKDPTIPVKAFKTMTRYPDQIVSVSNGFGGSTTVVMKPAAEMGNPRTLEAAIQPRALVANATCDAPANMSANFDVNCGGINNFPRPLAECLISNDGRLERSSTYEYIAGRYLFNGKNSRDHGFTKFVVRDDQTGMRSVTDYYVTKWFNGMPKRISTFDSAGDPISTSEQSYEVIAPWQTGTASSPFWFVRGLGSTSREYERGSLLTSTATTTLTYDDAYTSPVGKAFVKQAMSCVGTSGSDCTITLNDYSYDVNSWSLGRKNWVKTIRPTDTILSWQKTTYDPSSFWKATRMDAFLCPQANAMGQCFARGTTVPQGAGWVPIKTDIQYYANGNIRSFNNQVGGFESMEYDDKYQTYLKKHTVLVQPPGSSTDGKARSAGGLATQQPNTSASTNTYNLVKEMTYDEAGRIKEERGYNNTPQTPQVTRYTYDGLGRVTSVTAPNGAVTATSYNNFGQVNFGQTNAQHVVVSTKVGETPEIWSSTKKYFDGGGKGYKTVAPSDQGTNITIISDKSESFDRRERIVRYDDPYQSNSPQQRYTLVTFDDRGRTKRIQRMEDGTLKHLRFYSYGPQMDEINNAHASTRLVGITDAKNRTTLYDFNERGNLIDVFDPLGQQLHYNYNHADMVTEVLLPHTAANLAQRRVAYKYDSFGRVKEKSGPMGIGTTYAFYNPTGTLQYTQNPNGHQQWYWYDSLGRVTKRKIVNRDRRIPNRLTHLVYDQMQGNTNPYNKGQLLASWEAIGEGTTAPWTQSYAFKYNAVGQLIEKTTRLPWVKNAQGAVLPVVEQFTYDLAGRPFDVTLPDALPTVNVLQYSAAATSTVVGYRYGLGGNNTSILKNNRPLAAMTYNPMGQVLTRTVNGVVGSYTYRPDNFLDVMHYYRSRNNETLMKLKYHYDDVHNITRIQDEFVTPATVGGRRVPDSRDENQIFQYDRLDRLITADGVYGHRDYRYNEVGDMWLMGLDVFNTTGTQNPLQGYRATPRDIAPYLQSMAQQ
ncbi:MAG: RHS repeat protein [Deltaproteobacteria bacterium]|nr:RHS repeat protein [Deltaproteobacteria bacterium]